MLEKGCIKENKVIISKMTDYELIEKKDYLALWEKYTPLIRKFYNKAHNSTYYYLFPNSFEDFKFDMYEVVVKAAEAIKLNKIKDKNKWCFYAQLYHYLQNATDRDTISKYMRHRENKILSYDNVEAGEEVAHYFDKINNENEVWDSFTNEELGYIQKKFSREYIGMKPKEKKEIEKSIKEKLNLFWEI